MDEEILRELKIMNNKMTRITYLLTATCLYIDACILKQTHETQLKLSLIGI